MLAQAAAAPATAPNPNGQMITMVGYIVILGFIFYFLTIRPQSKKAKEHAALLAAMKPGDKVVTSGGVVGTVVSVKERTVSLRSAETKLEVLKSAVSEITERAGEATAGES
jgi:preprotein translocase subunit YajC